MTVTMGKMRKELEIEGMTIMGRGGDVRAEMERKRWKQRERMTVQWGGDNGEVNGVPSSLQVHCWSSLVMQLFTLKARMVWTCSIHMFPCEPPL